MIIITLNQHIEGWIKKKKNWDIIITLNHFSFYSMCAICKWQTDGETELYIKRWKEWIDSMTDYCQCHCVVLWSGVFPVWEEMGRVWFLMAEGAEGKI